jgi:hypothetical protein
MILKEAVDVFAKSRAEYIRPPQIDGLVDMVSGIIGVGLAVWIWKARRKRVSTGLGK